jgi:glucan phosphoethanolaminetransferase (alkaline phosphatase superfamily)
MHPRASVWICGVATAALALYVWASLSISFQRSLHQGFCDTAEHDCSLPWTTARVVTWILWGVLGLILAGTAIVSYRSGARRAALAGLASAALLALAAIVLFRSL